MTKLASRTVLQQLLEEVDQTDPELLPPPDAKEKGEKLITVLTDDYVRRVFSLGAFYRREGKRMQVDLECSGEDPKTNSQFNQYRQKHDTLQEIFWYLVRMETAGWELGSIGIRKGWEIVTVDDSEKAQLPPILRKLLEG